MNWNQNLISQLESLLFIAGDEGIGFSKLCHYTQTDGETMKAHLDYMQHLYKEDASRGLELVVLANTYQFVTKRHHAEVIQRMIETTQLTALSQAALEVLAIIAYKQPITRVEVDDIRGVKSDSALQTLVARALIKEVGRAEGTGRAILYGTTTEFMQVFGLEDMTELPPLPDEESEEEETDLFMTKFQEQFNLETAEKG